MLAGINTIETDFGRNVATSSAGAIGWMRSCPPPGRATVDANGDGKKDPYGPEDAIFGTANYLHASGAPGSWHRAVFCLPAQLRARSQLPSGEKHGAKQQLS
ncbi:MAG: lytic murein transglycosylase [Gaiellaceae bacterium]